MGDQIGSVVSGKLYYVPQVVFHEILTSKISNVDKAKLFSALCRINTLYMIAKAGSGHIGSSFSSMDIMSWIHLFEIGNDLNHDRYKGNIFFSSKGHDAPALYSIWIGQGKLDFKFIHTLRRLGGLPGHPDVSIPNVITNTGSLGMGISKAKGIIYSNRLRGEEAFVYVLTGDGELQEGQFWESLLSAANNKYHELIVIIDHNKMQSDSYVSKVSDLGDIEGKLNAFGWYVSRCDGNNIEEFSSLIENIKNIKDRPKIVIADTVKGKGVSFMEHTSLDSDVEYYKFHSGAPTTDLYLKAVDELIQNANQLLLNYSFDKLELISVDSKPPTPSLNQQRLIKAYSEALLQQATVNNKIVALDADLVLDTGLIPFKEKFPDRFIECGIAEQDMVSQAGGMALMRLLPIVHSFACFLSTRPNEQIYNNSSEKTKIIYVGSLAGLLPAGPGHSHQAVRDISTLGAIPDILIIEPCCEFEVHKLFDWAINKSLSTIYFRLVSIPVDIPFSLNQNYSVEKGKGNVLLNGSEISIISYGPIMLSIAYNAALIIKERYDFEIKVINMPWLNYINQDWMDMELKNVKNLFVLENHLEIGGLGDRISNYLAKSNFKMQISFHHLAIRKFPSSGTNDEVLDDTSLSIENIVDQVSVYL